MTTTSGLVSPAEVAAQLDAPDVVLVEVDEEAATHHWSHIPGATFVDWQDCRRALLAGGRAATAAFEQLMSVRGIRPSDQVILYGDGANQYASAVLWLMRHHGHRSLRLMDGGRAAWLAQGRPVTEAETVRPPTDYRAGPPDLSVRATRDDLVRLVTAPSAGEVVVDCRTEREYCGLAAGPASDFGDLCSERGHVPGAVHVAAGELVAPDGTLRPAAELEQVMRGHGVRPEQSVTAYCHTSDRSCLVWFALSEVLGWPSVRVYDGGWLEYGHLLGVPVVRPHDGADPSGARSSVPPRATARPDAV